MSISVYPRRSTLTTAAILACVVATTWYATPPASAARPATKAMAIASLDGTVAFGRRATARLLKDTGASSISVALTNGDRLVWQETFGAIDAAGTAPAATTRYGIGSVSKTFAAVAVMELVDAGLVELDAPFERYVPSFEMASPEAAQITVRMLLDHSAGLPGSDYANAATSTPWDGYLAQLLDGLRTQHLKTTPGSMSVYCNDCYSLVEALVPAVTGRSYESYVTDTILIPLGMTHSRYATRPFPDGTWAPVMGADGAVEPMEVLNLLATGGLYSTAADMGRFGAMLLGGGTFDGSRVLSAGAVAEMTRLQTATTLQPATDDPWAYGLGFDTVRQLGLAAVHQRGWSKGGDTTVYHSAFTLAPDADLAVVVLSAGRTMSSSAAETLAERILLRALVERGVLTAMPRPLTTAALPSRVTTTPAHPVIDGIYLASGAAFKVQSGTGGHATLSTLVDGVWAGTPDGLQLRVDGRYWRTTKQLKGLSVVTGWGRYYLVLRRPEGAGHYLTDLVLGQRVEPLGALTDAWVARLDRDWVPVDEIATSLGWATPSYHLAEVPGVGGVVGVWSGSSAMFVDGTGRDTLGSSFLVIPTMQGRDLADVIVDARPDGDWPRMGSSLLRPVAGIPALAVGSTTLTIDPEGVAAWLRADAATALTVRTSGATAWKTLDTHRSPVAAGDGEAAGVEVPVGGFLVVFAAPGDVVAVDAG